MDYYFTPPKTLAQSGSTSHPKPHTKTHPYLHHSMSNKRTRIPTGDTPEQTAPPHPSEEEFVEIDRPSTPVGDSGLATPTRHVVEVADPSLDPDLPPPTNRHSQTPPPLEVQLPPYSEDLPPRDPAVDPTARQHPPNVEGKNKSTQEWTNLQITPPPDQTQTSNTLTNFLTHNLNADPEVKREDEGDTRGDNTPSRGRGGRGRGARGGRGGRRSLEARKRRAEKQRANRERRQSGANSAPPDDTNPFAAPPGTANPFSTPPNRASRPALLPRPTNTNSTPPVARPTATVEWLGEGPPNINKLRQAIILDHYTTHTSALRITDARTAGRSVVLTLADEDSLSFATTVIEGLSQWSLGASVNMARRLVIRAGSWLHGATGRQLSNMLAACNPPVGDQPPFPTSTNSITIVGWHYSSPPSTSTAPAPPLPTHTTGFLEVSEDTYQAILARSFYAKGATGGILRFEFSRRQ